jgi:hypothetical protein
VVNLLQRFPGYTLSTLMEEDVELLRLVNIVADGTAQKEVTGSDG